MIFLVIQASIPLGMGLLGTFSLVGFRSPVKDPAEIGFLLLLIASSIGTATGNYLAVALLFVIAFIALAVQRLARNRFTDVGKGHLMISTVNANYNNGIASHDDLRITGGTFTVNAANDGLKGRDGMITISDDSIHSNDRLTINGANITLASGDDGIHSDSTLEVNGGDIRITECYEGIESAAITVNDGNIHLVARDDGINAASGNAGSSMGGRPGRDPFDFSGDNSLYVNGGYIAIVNPVFRDGGFPVRPAGRHHGAH